MIYLTRLNHTSMVLNSELIEQVETTPDTVITLTTGQKLMVRESPEDIIARVVRYRRSIFAQPGSIENRQSEQPAAASKGDSNA